MSFSEFKIMRRKNDARNARSRVDMLLSPKLSPKKLKTPFGIMPLRSLAVTILARRGKYHHRNGDMNQ